MIVCFAGGVYVVVLYIFVLWQKWRCGASALNTPAAGEAEHLVRNEFGTT